MGIDSNNDTSGVMIDIDKKSIIENRYAQSSSSRLAEILTGLRSDDVRLIDRLEEDKGAIRYKYGLPDEDMRRQDPREYYDRLVKIAKDNHLSIRPTEWDQKFFDENPDASAKLDRDSMTLVADIDEKDRKHYILSLRELEHELIHGLQVNKYPNMPIEVMEYEAHLASAPIEFMRKHPKEIDLGLFGTNILGSVMNWYKRNESWPVWNNPEWFLENVDKIELNKKEFEALDDIDRSGFGWNRITNEFEQVLEYLVGMNRDSGDDEKLKRRLMFDKLAVRQMYGLPESPNYDGNEYISYLKSKCEEQGIVVGDRNDFKEKYGREMKSDGYCDDEEPLIFLKDIPEDEDEIRKFIGEFEHEFIHAMQVKTGKAKEHSIEQNEYEAIIGANLNIHRLNEDFLSVTDHIAWGLMKSLYGWYQRKGITPAWGRIPR